MKRTKQKHHSSKFWQAHLKAWHASGLSQMEYCRRHNIRSTTFNHHKVHKFGTVKSDKKEQSLDLVALPFPFAETEKKSLAGANSGIDIRLGNKASITIARNFDRKSLADILRMVSEL